jgi:hypothetical protein
MLEQLDLTDDEREALEGDRDAIEALAERLANIPTPAGPTPNELGGNNAFVSLTAVKESLRVHIGQPGEEGTSRPVYPSVGNVRRKRPIVRKISSRFLATLSHVGRRSTRLAGAQATRSPRSRSFAPT